MREAVVRRNALPGLALLSLTLVAAGASAQVDARELHPDLVSVRFGDLEMVADADGSAFARTRARFDGDLAAMRAHRPGYAFWRHIFTIPDGSIAFGSAQDGRLLASFPARGDWRRSGNWADGWMAGLLDGEPMQTVVNRRRDQVAALLEPVVGAVVHNPTRGNFLLPNVRRYGSFLGDWGAIYERFGVPREIGLAQAILESGLDGRIRSEARALGFCQWLPENWERLKRLADHAIEGYNQTTQAPYCAAYLTVLATKYDSFIPALSEHHAGGTNVARVVISGSRLGARDPREQYLVGAALVRDLRELSPSRFRPVYATYGPRSFRYAEMVFGNALTVTELLATVPRQQVFAMRTRRAIPLAEITRRTGLSAAEVRRFNPALVNRVPARANLYLPSYIEEFGTDVAFWHRAPSAAYTAVLNDFIGLQATLDEWNDPAFRSVLRDFQERFEDTETEEGSVMATVLGYAIGEMYGGARLRILTEYLGSSRIQALFEQGVGAREDVRGAVAAQ